MGRSKRSAGQPWRVLVHDLEGQVSHHVTSDRAFGGETAESEHERVVELPGTELVSVWTTEAGRLARFGVGELRVESVNHQGIASGSIRGLGELGQR